MRMDEHKVELLLNEGYCCCTYCHVGNTRKMLTGQRDCLTYENRGTIYKTASESKGKIKFSLVLLLKNDEY